LIESTQTPNPTSEFPATALKNLVTSITNPLREMAQPVQSRLETKMPQNLESRKPSEAN
jgi:hypothetical protein